MPTRRVQLRGPAYLLEVPCSYHSSCQRIHVPAMPTGDMEPRRRCRMPPWCAAVACWLAARRGSRLVPTVEPEDVDQWRTLQVPSAGTPEWLVAMTGGCNTNCTAVFNDYWVSKDGGQSWSAVASDAPYPARAAFGAAVTRNGSVVVATMATGCRSSGFCFRG